MARSKVEQIRCDRCGRMEFQPVKDGTIALIRKASFEARLDDKVLKYDDLCDGCKEAIKHIWESDLVEWKTPVKHAKFTAPGPTLPADRAAPVSVPPDFSPPKPHSPHKK
jgi:hypothetical protein